MWQSPLTLPAPCTADGEMVGFGLQDSCRLCSEHQLTPFPGPSDFHLLFPLLRASNSSTQQLKMVQEEKVESASRKKGPAVLTPLRNLHILWGTMLLQTLLLSLSRRTCTLTCAVICSWNCWDLISTLHPCSWEIIYFSRLGRNSIACKAISVCLKEENKPMILPSSRLSGDRPQPWPAAPVQLAVKLKSLPAHHKARGAGVLFSSLRAFYFTRSRPDPSPSPGQKGKAVGMELNTPR